MKMEEASVSDLLAMCLKPQNGTVAKGDSGRIVYSMAY
jgi:hypothetical protein